jgi:hypothetical protein
MSQLSLLYPSLQEHFLQSSKVVRDLTLKQQAHSPDLIYSKRNVRDLSASVRIRLVHTGRL